MEFGTVEAFIGVGTNLGRREDWIAAALEGLAALPGTRVLAVSRIYETQPVGGPPQGAYLNLVARLETRLPAADLLSQLHEIEGRAGRRRGERNAPRTLDLDLLLYGDQCIDTLELQVPHPRLHERAFVLEPLCELAPALRHPVCGASMERLASRVRSPGMVRPHGTGDQVE